MERKDFYPESGSVVIVDDNIDEALPLMGTLARLDISYKYFSGKKDELPQQPLDNVRILFLDILLEGMEGVQSDKTKLSTLGNIVSRIISPECSPYIIIAWTKHQELVDNIKNVIEEQKRPLFVLTIEKDTVKKGDYYDTGKIQAILADKIKEFGAFNFFLSWQNIVSISARKVINEIATIYHFDNKWDANINQLFNSLAEAYSGKEGQLNMQKNAMMCFNNLYFDIIERHIVSISSEKDIKSPVVLGANNEEITGELNRRFLLSKDTNKSPVPGNRYLAEKLNHDIGKSGILSDCRSICEEIFQIENNHEKNIKELCPQIYLEVSPFCDYAQQKWKMCRILPGLKCPLEHIKSIKKADYIYLSPLFRIDDKLLYFVFDIRYLTSIPIPCLEEKEPFIRFRKELLNDIQTKISSHINRLGLTYKNYEIKDKKCKNR